MEDILIVNSDGEVLKTLDGVHDIERIVEVPMNKILMDKRSVHGITETERVDYSFLKVNYLVLRDVIKESPKYDLLLKMMPYVNFRDNVLVYSNGKPMRKSDIGKIFGLSKNVFPKKLKDLEEGDLIKYMDHEHYGKCIVLNPYIAMRGNRIEKRVLDLFRYSIWAELSCTKSKEVRLYEYG